MPTLQHESIIELFRANPRLVVDFLRDEFGLDVPKGPLRVEDAHLPSLTPSSYDADLVVVVDKALAIVLEVQLAIDPRKHMSWLVYLANLRARASIPVVLVVVAPQPEVARWAAEPIYLGPPDWTLRPLVIGPERIPVLTRTHQARRSPELLVLSAMVHGKGPLGLSIARAALRGWSKLDSARARLYLDLVLAALNEATRRKLELMMIENYQIQNEVLRNFVRMIEERAEATGKATGEARGEAKALLQLLEERGLPVEPAVRTRVMACTDTEQLSRWFRRAVHAPSVAEVFDP